MAELGPIPFQQTSGDMRLDDATPDVLGAVANLGKAVKETVDNGVLSEFREEANAAIDDARENATTASVFDGPSDLPGEEGRIQRRARGLQAQRTRGTRPQRSLAELELKKLLNDAQNEHPRLARELAQELNLVTSSSYKLDEIALIDDLSKEQGAMAKEELDAMVDHGRDVLFIDPSIPVGSDEFARQYRERQAIYGLKQAHSFDLMLAATTADMSAQDKLGIVNRAVRNRGNIVDTLEDSFMEAVVAYRTEVAKPNEQRDIGFMETFTGNIRPTMIEQLNFHKTELMGILPDVFDTVGLRNSPTYEQAQLTIEDQITRIDALIAAVNSDDKDALDHVIASRRVRDMQVRQQNASYDNFMTLLDPSAEGFRPFMETVAKLDLTGGAANLGNTLAQTGMQSFQDVLGLTDSADVLKTVWYSSGQGVIDDTTTPDNIKRSLMANWSGQQGFYGDANSTEAEDLEKSVAHLEMMRQASADAVATKSPATAGIFMTDATNALMVMAALGRPARNQLDATTAILADRNIFEAALLEGNGANMNRRIALADAASDFYTTVEPGKQMQRIQTALEQPYLGRTVKDFLSFKPSDAEPNSTTELTFDINTGALKAQLEARMGGGIGEGQIRAHSQQLRELALPSVNKMNEMIRATSHIDALQQTVIDESSSDYINMADQLGWIDYLMGQ